MLPTRVQLISKPGEFDLTIIACPKFDCPCMEISLVLHEVNGDCAK